MMRALLPLLFLVACDRELPVDEAAYIVLTEDGECDEESDEAVYWYPQVPDDAICEAICCGVGANELEYCVDADIVRVAGEARVTCGECASLEVHCIYVD